MKIILLKTIDKVGFKGDIINVKDGYARNYLLPNRLAVIASETNLKRHERKIKNTQEKKVKQKRLEAVTAKKINRISLSCKAKADEKGKLYGSIGPKTIAKLLKQEGYKVKSKNIKMKDPIKVLGQHEVKLDLNGNETNIIVNVQKEK
jgi:large subunit ribosomal protein L9